MAVVNETMLTGTYRVADIDIEVWVEDGGRTRHVWRHADGSIVAWWVSTDLELTLDTWHRWIRRVQQ